MKRVTEHFDHDICPKCDCRSVPLEGVPDQLLRGCPKCFHEWWETISSPPYKGKPMRQSHQLFTAKDGGILCKVEQHGDDAIKISCDWEPVVVRQTTEQGPHGEYPVITLTQANEGRGSQMLTLDEMEELLSIVEPAVLAARERNEMDTLTFRRYQEISAGVADLREADDRVAIDQYTDRDTQ